MSNWPMKVYIDAGKNINNKKASFIIRLYVQVYNNVDYFVVELTSGIVQQEISASI